MSVALFGLMRSQGEVSTGLGVQYVILSKIAKIKQTVNSQAKLVSAKRRKQNIEFGADASKTPCIACMLIFHMEPLMESMLMLQNMPHL